MANGEIKEIWSSLAAAGLIPSQQLSFWQLQTPALVGDDVEAFWNWLIAAGMVTPFQRELILHGVASGIAVGDFLLWKRVQVGPWSGLFQARHRPTGHVAALDFFSENSCFRGGSWPTAAEFAERIARSRPAGLIPTLGVVVQPDHSFIVSDWSEGRWLPEKIALKARLPWETAIPIAASVALALGELHRHGFPHGQVWPWTVELTGKTRARLRMTWRLDEHRKFSGSELLDNYLAPEQLAGDPPSVAADIYSLGCLTYRLLTGRSPNFQSERNSKQDESNLPEVGLRLEKYGLPSKLTSLIRDLLAPQAEQRPTSAFSVAESLCAMASISIASLSAGEDYSATANQLALLLDSNHDGQSPPGVLRLGKPQTAAVAEVAISAANETQSTPRRPLHRQSHRWVAPVSLFTGMSLFVAALVFGWRYLSTTTAPLIANREQPMTIAPMSNKEEADSEVNIPPSMRPAVVQTVVEDNGNLLWESPTQGPALDLSSFPPGLRIYLSVRPRAFLAEPQGALIWQAMGHNFLEWFDQTVAHSGVSLDAIECFEVGLYSGNDERYEALIRVQLAARMSRHALVENWNGHKVEQESRPVEADLPYLRYSCQDRQYLVWPDATNRETVETFLFGPEGLIQAAIDNGPQRPLTGVLRQLADVGDRQRHLNVLFVSSALFNEAGQSLMSGPWTGLNRRLRLAFGDTIRGGLWSVHIDQGNYVELIVNHQPDAAPLEIGQSLLNEWRSGRDETLDAIAAWPAHAYWNRVRMRYGNMLIDAVRQTRVGVERGHVVLNAWLPSAAVHNIVASSQLVFEMAGIGPTAPSVGATAPVTGPRTLTELLAQPRSLSVTTNPDLNLLLQGIVEEVRVDNPTLPFVFEIRLAGPDLLLEGITQNQRPGDFELMQQPLSEILTTIMVRANPDRTNSGPADENCKLVWVIEPRPEAEGGGERIAVTTRQAARQRGLTLPEAFRTESDR